MKKIILSLLLLGMTASCSDTVISDGDLRKNELIAYKVNDIQELRGDTILCEYNITTEYYTERDADVWFRDTIGKFKIGDTGTLNFIKTK